MNEKSISWSLFRVSQNVKIRICVECRRMNSYPRRKWWRDGYAGSEKRWRCSHARILKSKLDRHHQIKINIKFHLSLCDSCQEKFQNIVTWGVKSPSRNPSFTCISMESLFSGVRPLNTHKKYKFLDLNRFFETKLTLNFFKLIRFIFRGLYLTKSNKKNAIIFVKLGKPRGWRQGSYKLLSFIPCLVYGSKFVKNHDKMRTL